MARLSTAVVALAAAIFALVPLVLGPYDEVRFAYQGSPPLKFGLLLSLSGLLLATMLAAVLSGARFVRVPMLLPAAAFLAVSALSAAFSEDAYLALVGSEAYHDGLLTMAAGVLLFYATARFLDSRVKIRFFLATGVLSATLIALYGISQRFGLDPVYDLVEIWPEYGGRVFSTLGNPIFLAAYLTLMAGAAAALYFEAGPGWQRLLWLSALAVIGACWFYTYTRGAILGVGVALPIVLWLARRRMGTVRPLLVPLATLAAAVLVAAVPVAMELGGVPGRLGETGDVGTMSRLLIWRDTVPVILERPLLGHGPDNFREPFSRYEGEDLASLMNSEPIDKAHNELLQVTATTGVLGLAAYLWLFAVYFRNSYRHGGWTLVALSGGVLAYILQLQTIFTTLATGVAFWVVLGVSVAVMRLPPSHDGPVATGRVPRTPS
jgi:O-antigen ligase